MTSKKLINISDFHRKAKEKLPQMFYDYYASGAHDEITLTDNREAYSRIKLRYRVMVDVSERDMSVDVLGSKASMPILVAPTAFHGLASPEAECATARATDRAETLMILSTLSNTALEDVKKETSTPLFFQLYVYRDRNATEELVRRAEAADYKAIVVTVDAPILGTRERDVRNDFRLPEDLTIKNMSAAQMEKMSKETGSGLGNYFASSIDPSLSWKDIGWLGGITKLPVLVKGVVHPEDAKLALENGAAGVVVSNHGGRQLDTSLATIDALPDIAEAMNGKGTLLVDGGVQRGTDVFKALALGADAVLIGRPVLWGLAADGEQGVHQVLEILRTEFDKTMMLCGFCSVDEIKKKGKTILF
ncbi:MAG: alpha-hydroxy-acid oxidizing protein [Candidatus Mycalebacterium zealandia]|nr:MAG: alpha-hydroxy-acid oxidizing protein [Candidatus Mycalebacterium zealandia]